MREQSEPRVFMPATAGESRFEIRPPGESDDLARRSGKVTQPDTFAARLRTAQSLRDAIILREILGPPRSLQPIDLTNGLS
jgi:hypothetical protein